MSRTCRTYPDAFRLIDAPINNRDKKPWYKPDKVWKYERKRARKAKERNALRSGDIIPIFKKTDEWGYL